MVVCKFFMNGYCRYGQNCRYQHIYGSKYNYTAPSNAPSQSQDTQGVTDEQLLKQVQMDVQAVLSGNQWLLSTYAPLKGRPSLPGLTDLSPEEARLFIYEAKANNSVDQAVSYMNNLFKEARSKHEELLKATPTLGQVLRSLYNGEATTSPFANSQPFSDGSKATSLFRGAVQNSAFGPNAGSGSVFGQQQNPSVFGNSNSNNTAAKSIFAQASQSIFGASSNASFGSNQPSSGFGAQNAEAKSIFAQANQNVFNQGQPQSAASIFASASQNIFGPSKPVQQNTSPFNTGQNSSPFGSNQSDSPFGSGWNSSPFASTQNVSPFSNSQTSVFKISDKPSAFGGNVFEQSSADDPTVYSNMEDLTEDDVEAFKSDEFKLGFVPELPPPRSLCV